MFYDENDLYNKSISSLRYQLLYSVAGIISYAKSQKASKAFFIVHTFKSDETNQIKYKENQQDLDNFINLISNSNVSQVKNNELVGHIKVPGSEYISPEIELYIGKIETLLID